MEKLEKGYKKEELNEFFKTAFKNRKTPRRTADGGWETVDAIPEIHLRSQSISEIVPETAVPEAAAPVVVEVPPKKSGAWKRFKSLFKKNNNFFCIVLL